MQTYPLTTAQNTILTMAQYYSGTSLCNIGGTIEFDIEGLNADIIRKTINVLVEKMDGFRIRLCKNGNNIEQHFEDYSYITIPVVDMRGKSEQDIDKYVQSTIAEPIELFDGQLYRWTILQKDHSWVIVALMHHIIGDAWSFKMIAETEMNLLEATLKEEPYECNIGSYTVHIENEAQYFDSTKYMRDKQYWSSVYAEKPIITQLKPGKEKSRNPKAHRLTEIIDGDFFDRISKFCTEYRYSPAILFEAVVLIYLKKINGQDSVPSVGMAALNRLGRSEKNTFGMFISILPINVPFSVDVSLLDVCKQLSEVQTKAFFHQRYPYTHLLQDIRETHHDVDSLYDVMVSYQNATMHSNVKAHTKWYTNGNSEVPLALHIDDRDNVGKYVLNLDYQLEQFSDEEAELLLRRLLYITEQIVSSPEQTVAETKIIPKEEYHRIVYEFNNTVVPYSKEKCLHELFEETVFKSATQAAVVFENNSYTYAELNQKANRIAYKLRKIGITRNDIVPIIARRSHLVLAAQFGVLKAGGAYLPIDPDYPQDRIDYMLDDAKCKAAIIYQATKPSRIDSVIDLANLSIDETLPNPQNINEPSDLCYVIYTSGSTGKPKGTMLTHRNAVNFCHRNKFNVCKKVIDKEVKRFLSITTIGFDMYVTESLLALAQGLTVYFANDKQSKSQSELSKFVIEHDIEILETTPTKLKMLMSDPNKLTYLKHFKKIILGGEPFSRALYNDLLHNTNAQIFNLYGPTETTVWSSINEVVGEDFSVGSPTANTQIYILDELGLICPIGVAGELCISGDGVCRGYLNREELTAEKFVDNPFGDGKLYKTGDLALYRPDGKLEHLGRIDTQVKIRGLRVELGEIESNICAFDGVTNTAVVIVKYDEKDFLCAFYQSLMEIDESEMKASLSKVIPNYMVPNLFIRLNSFPMTSSGKIARGVLTKYDISGLIEPEEYKAPETELQKLLCKEFEGLLKISPVSINLDFFGAGGNSIHVIEMLVHLPEEFHLSAKDIYDNPTVESLALHIEHSGKESSNQVLNAKKQTHRYPKLVMKSSKTTNCCLFTGATGYLGSHLLMEYLTNSDGKAYCIVRGADITESRQRLIDTLNFYFGEQTVNLVAARIVIVCGDITQLELGLSHELYQQLVDEIEAVYHSAADVRHFTRYEDSYAVNVLGTRNIIDLCKAASATLHHMSTISVSGIGMCSQTQENIIFDEQSFDIGQNYSENTYIHTKYLAENIIYDAVEKGLSASIYRLGNISERHSDGVFQKNSGSNAFYIRETAIKKLNAISEFFRNVLVDKSYVDECATAIFALSKRAFCGVYHISNPNLVSLYDYFVKKYPETKIIENDAFLKSLSEVAKTDSTCAILQVYLNMMMNSSKHHVEVSCQKTVDVLKNECNFEWSK